MFISWLWSYVQWWHLLIVVIVVVGICWQWIAPLWFLLPKSVRWFIAAVIAIIVAVQYGRNKGGQAERDRRAALNKRAVATRDKIDDQVKAMPPNAVSDALRRGGWMRND